MAVGNKIIPLWLCFCPAVFQVRHSKTAHPDTQTPAALIALSEPL